MLTFEKQYIVITEDRDIQAYAWRHNSVPINSGDFLGILEGDFKVAFSREKLKKGDPKTPSKKEKAIRRALSKL